VVHLFKKGMHYASISIDIIIVKMTVESVSTEVVADAQDHEDYFTKADEALFILKLKAGHRLSQEAITDVMSMSKELVRSKLHQLEAEFVNTESVGRAHKIAEDMFTGLASEYQQIKVFEEMFGYIKLWDYHSGHSGLEQVTM
jgi:biotin operon repressor